MAETQSSTVITVSVVFAVLTFISLVIRIFARTLLVKHIGTDDVLIIIATLFSFAFIGTSIRTAQLGLGSHMEDILSRGTENLLAYEWTLWLSSILYNLCLGFIKVSVLALYVRLGDKQLRRLAAVMIVLVGAQTTANFMVCVLQCSPIEAAYDLAIPAEDKTCININAFYVANAACHILTDLLTYTLPIPLVLKLHVPRPQRIGLGVMLSLGLLACTSSIIRIIFLPPLLVSQDTTWDGAKPMYWSVIETNVGILAASVPSLKVIAKAYFPHLLGTQSGVDAGGCCGDKSAIRISGQSRAGRDRQTFEKSIVGCLEQNSTKEALAPGAPDGQIEVMTEVCLKGYDRRAMEAWESVIS